MMASAIARIWRALLPEQIRKWSVKPAAFRRSSTTMSAAFLSSAARTAASIDFGRRVVLVRRSVLAMQPACRGCRSVVALSALRRCGRVKPVLLNVLPDGIGNEAGDRFAAGAAFANRS